MIRCVKLVILTALALAFFLQSANAQSMLEKNTVFLANTEGIRSYRIPGMVVTTKGTVLAYCEARKITLPTGAKLKCICVAPPMVAKLGNYKKIAHAGVRFEGNPTKKKDGETEQTVNNPVAIVNRQTGNIHMLYCINYSRCFSMRSNDDGITWSKPVDITATFEPFRMKYDWNVIATGPGHGIQLKSGRLVVPIWLAYGKPGEHKPSASATIYSDDNGKTWKAGEMPLPNEGEMGNPNETMITELSDGSVMLVNRNVSKANRKLITTSPDGATNWTKPYFHQQLWEPICMASIVSHPSNPGTLIYSNPHTLALMPKERDTCGQRQA